MKISSKLEEMVADLVSDEKAKREEVEAVLSKIHELTEAYFNPEREALKERDGDGVARLERLVAAEEPPAPVLSQAEKLTKFTAGFERRGMPPERAKEAAEEAMGRQMTS